MHYYGIWDCDELYDLQGDPLELKNLIYSKEHQAIIADLKRRLFAELEAQGGMYIPLYPDSGQQMSRRDANRSHAADFPAEMYKSPERIQD